MAIEVAAVPWGDPDGSALRDAQRVELDTRYGADTEPGPKPSADDIALFLVARLDGEAVGCGALRSIDAEHGEIKRMYVAPPARGAGVSRAVLAALEAAARERGWTRLVLETGTLQPDAIRFYTREGYEPIERFGHYAESATSLCFGKALSA
ncbi:GNAT family N-acetyltransferase [Pseudolysinimonas sp.]|uniref:GNAT family N-acetyltransferase n=1 Tax=Pseudolysinimonas sp. TaxID=2680009 RepID=UPI003F7D1BB6